MYSIQQSNLDTSLFLYSVLTVKVHKVTKFQNPAV